MKEIRCAEIGFFGDCQTVVRGESEEAVLGEAAMHAKETHGLRDEDVNAESLQKVRAAIRDA